MPRRSIGALTALLLLSLALAACGGGTANPTTDASAAPANETATPVMPDASTATGGGIDGTLTPGTLLNACEIVTSDDIKAATKATTAVAAGTLELSPTVLSPARTECRYEGEFGGILVELTPDDGENLYDAAEGAYKDAAVMPGIGDGAFNSDDNNRAFIWKDNVTVMLTMFVADPLTQVDVATDLGKAIVEKL
jgi:hypothetical protein